MKTEFGGGLALLACVIMCPCFPARKKGGESFGSKSLPRSPSANSGVPYSISQLTKATQNFAESNIIGHDGFGVLYKGKLPDGTLIVVKRAKKLDSRRVLEFKNEINMLSKIEHLNLVRLLGHAEDHQQRILVMEYVPNGNLREHLDGVYGDTLNFGRRLDIAIDVAHALTYLHLYADQPIIHRDIKSISIFLTDNFRAKVAEFGFSKIGPLEGGATHISTQVKGTAGYLDPEYLHTNKLTTKSDVYSFGILLVELFSGRKPIEMRRPNEERITIRWAFKKSAEGNLAEVLDPKLEKTENIYSTFEKITELAFQCSAPSRRDRPSMKEASETLWEIRRDFQASLSYTTTPRRSSHELPAGPFSGET